jgi:methylmalonyl-CoA mutase
MSKDLFEGFEAATKNEWIANLEKELKGKKYEEFVWKLDDKIEIEPFYVRQEVQGINHEFLSGHNPEWQVGEDFETENAEETNKLLLHALMNGVSAPVLRFKDSPDAETLAQLLKGVGLPYIDTHIAFDCNETDFSGQWQLWKNLAENQGQNMADLPLFFGFSPLEFEDAAIEKSFAAFLKSALPSKASLVHVDGYRYHTNEHNVSNELYNILKQAEAYISYFKAYEIDPAAAVKSMHFTLGIGKSYFVEIAKLRAFKLLWAQMLLKHDIAPFLPYISVRFAHSTYGTDRHDNLINASTMAMSAVLGGCSHLVVTPIGTSSSDRRLSRNVQLILKHESGFDMVADPAAGSYYIEKITDMLVKAVSV